MLPEDLYGTAAVRDAEKRAIASGVSGAHLMSRAGRAVFDVARERYPRARRWHILCGPGNNGGDGYVVASLAHASGIDARVHVIERLRRVSDETDRARHAWLELGPEHGFEPDLFGGGDLIIDAMFGIGVDRDLNDQWLDVVHRVNRTGLPVVAVDIPSGLNADSGRVMGAAVEADWTVTFIGLKAGLFTGEGRRYAGNIVYSSLGLEVLPDKLSSVAARRLSRKTTADLLPPRSENAHKGDAGRVLVIGGYPGMSGAARLCAEGAYRVGAGLVTVATHRDSAPRVAMDCAEVMTAVITSGTELNSWFEWASVVAIGTGLGQQPWSREIWAKTIEFDGPIVVDADALNMLARNPVKRPDWILTPHPGEAARLLQVQPSEIQADRFSAVRAIADRFGGLCVLKGSGTLIAGGQLGTTWLCDRGNAGMATGGTGDVLTGILAGLIGQGLPNDDAARLGVWIHATAGDRAAEGRPRGTMASDLLDEIRTVLNDG